ncbi:MAG: hypothetical protein OEW82_02690 [Dehalococcoidia bacterium]|nr:hypothetical protein [Dehalococcoidia bacterium]
MKISKPARWILTIGILAILLVGLGVNYARQIAEQSRLSADIAQAQQDFIKYAGQKEDLEARLSEANSRIASVQNEFRQYTESIEINETLLQAADDANVTITRLSSSLPEKEELNSIAYQVFSLSITAEGEVVDLLRFMRKLSDRFPSSSTNSVGITVSEGKSSLSLGIKIYVSESE